MFLQVHYLTSYHASLLNRDEAGLAKRIVFGGSPRVRISSQSQKRHWRTWLAERIDLPKGVRSRLFFDRQVKQQLVASGMDGQLAHDLTFHLAKGILTAAGDKDPLDKDSLAMKQPVLFGRPEADYFTSLVKEAARLGDEKAARAFLDERIKEGKKNFRALLQQAGIGEPFAGFEGALFGRFVTSDILARVDAPVHVAHAFTTHELDTEVDFFTVVDDLQEDDETGAAHAGDMELGTGVFYGYVVVDIPLLISNLTGCERTAWRQEDAGDARALLSRLVQAIAQVSPGAKLGATAPYARAECIVLESGEAQPRSLANSFLQPIRFRRDSNPMAASVAAMARYLDSLDGMYGSDHLTRFVSSLHAWPRDDDRTVPLSHAIEHSLNAIFGGSS